MGKRGNETQCKEGEMIKTHIFQGASGLCGVERN